MKEYIITNEQYLELLFAARNMDEVTLDRIAAEIGDCEVIRCEDCKYCELFPSERPYCLRHQESMPSVRGFCFHAERGEW